MSKKKRKHKIMLRVGGFYRVIDGSPGGHPGQIFKIDKKDRAFYCILTGSMSNEEYRKFGLRKGYLRLKHTTDNNVEISLVRKRPFVGDRDDYGEKEFPDMTFKDDDTKIIISIQNKNPIYGPYYKKRKKIKKAPLMEPHSKL